MPDFIAGRYLLLGDEARTGGQSVIRKATDAQDGTIVAVKLLNGVRDEVVQKTFERETTNLRSLDHPNIIKMLDSGIDANGTYYVVLEWIEHSLVESLTDGGPLEWSELYEKVAAPLLSALSLAHLNKVEHRDIKPGNVLVRETGQPVLADFGISKLQADLGVSEFTVASFKSRPYAPPEDDVAVPYVRDVYSFGVLMLQALSATRISDFSDISPALQQVEVPAQIRELLGRCLATERSERPASGSLLELEFSQIKKSLTKSAVNLRPKISLQLTTKARTQIKRFTPDHPKLDVESFVGHDLDSETFAEFRLDRETGFPDRGTIQLVGNSCRYTLKVNEQSSSLTIVDVRQFEFENLEAMRRRYLDVSRIGEWTCRAHKLAGSSQSLELLTRALGDHEDAKRTVDKGADPDDIFEGWFRLLRAREDLARGNRKPIRYSEARRRGREADFTVTLQTDEDLVGSEIELYVEESRRWLARAEVVAQADAELTLRSIKPFPRLPARGLLTPFLGPTQIALQRQGDAITAIRDGRSARSDAKVLIEQPSMAAHPAPIEMDSWLSDIDASKQAAVRSAVAARDVVAVEGPPGTGKTRFIAEAVHQILKREPNSRILIVSQTHVAVDNAIERLDSAGVADLVRLGVADDARVGPKVRHLLLQHQMGRWAANLQKKAISYLEERARSAGVPTDYLRAALSLRQLAKVVDQINSIENYIVSEPEKGNGPEADGAQTDSASLQEKLDRLAERRAELIADARSQLAGTLTLRSDMGSDEARAAVELLVGNTKAGVDLLEVLDLQAEWLQRVVSDENLASSFLQTRRVIAGTCLGFLRHQAVRDLEIDVCILDEASKATATEALVPVARAKKWILIGDTKQLPPMDEEVLRAKDILEEYELDPDFVRGTLFQRMVDDLPEECRFILTQQYRMIRPIGDLISTCFYGGDLSSPRDTGLKGQTLFGPPVLWIDTWNLGPSRRENAPEGGGTSFANRTEAQVVANQLRTIDAAAEKGVLALPEEPDRPIEVLLIAPYRSQVEELRRRLPALNLKKLNVEVQSVDAVQGKEADIVFFSVTRSNVESRMGFLGEDFWRRINVALSRARYSLTIVGDAEFCKSSPGALNRVLHYIEENPSDCGRRAADNK